HDAKIVTMLPTQVSQKTHHRFHRTPKTLQVQRNPSLTKQLHENKHNKHDTSYSLMPRIVPKLLSRWTRFPAEAHDYVFLYALSAVMSAENYQRWRTQIRLGDRVARSLDMMGVGQSFFFALDYH